jgi:hypothetical protein
MDKGNIFPLKMSMYLLCWYFKEEEGKRRSLRRMNTSKNYLSLPPKYKEKETTQNNIMFLPSKIWLHLRLYHHE